MLLIVLKEQRAKGSSSSDNIAVVQSLWTSFIQLCGTRPLFIGSLCYRCLADGCCTCLQTWIVYWYEQFIVIPQPCLCCFTVLSLGPALFVSRRNGIVRSQRGRRSCQTPLYSLYCLNLFHLLHIRFICHENHLYLDLITINAFHLRT